MNKIGYILSAIMLIFGAISTLSSKGMYSSNVPIPGYDNQNGPLSPNHPAVYTALMFFGEFLCLPSYGVIKGVNHRKHKERTVADGKQKFKVFPHTFLFLIPTAFDLIGSQLFSMGNFYCAPSVYQVLRNLIVPFVALFSFILFRDYRKRFDLHHIIGLIGILVGAAGTGLASVFFADTTEGGDESKNAALGVLFTVLGCLFSAGFFFSEEIGLRRIDAHPFQGVGIEGSWGLILYAILLPIFNVVTDPFSDVNTLTGSKPHMANLVLWAKQFAASPSYCALHFLNIVGVYGFNVAGMSITKYASSSTRVTIDALRTIVVWAFGFAFKWETWNVKRTPTQMGCFIILVLGVLTYNRVLIKIPYMRAANKEDVALAAVSKNAEIEVQEHQEF